MEATRTTGQFIEQMQTEIPARMQENQVPGLAIALVEGRQTVWSQGFGIRDQAAPEPVTTDTMFEAASLTKPAVAWLALELCDQGVMDLDRPLADYTQAPPPIDDPRVRQITLRRVLSHTTGFPNWRKSEPDGQLRFKFTPGESFGYSGEGFLYLQRIMEGLTGQPLEDYARDRLFRPLGLRSTSLIWQDAFAARYARPHDAEGKPMPPKPYRQANAAYTMYITVSDYARFLALTLLQADPARVSLRPATLAEMLRPQSQMTEAIAWGLGWGLKRRDAGSFCWHWGDNGGTRNLVIAFPDTGDGVVIMTNGENGLHSGNGILERLPGGNAVSLSDFLQHHYGK